MDARAAVLVGQPAPRALYLRRGLHGQRLLDGRPVGDVPVELDLDRCGDPDGSPVTDVDEAPELLGRGEGGERARERRGLPVLAGRGTIADAARTGVRRALGRVLGFKPVTMVTVMWGNR